MTAGQEDLSYLPYGTAKLRDAQARFCCVRSVRGCCAGAGTRAFRRGKKDPGKNSKPVGVFSDELLRQARTIYLYSPELGRRVRDGRPAFSHSATPEIRCALSARNPRAGESTADRASDQARARAPPSVRGQRHRRVRLGSRKFRHKPPVPGAVLRDRSARGELLQLSGDRRMGAADSARQRAGGLIRGRSRSASRTFSSIVFRLNTLLGGALARELVGGGPTVEGAVRGG